MCDEKASVLARIGAWARPNACFRCGKLPMAEDGKNISSRCLPKLLAIRSCRDGMLDDQPAAVCKPRRCGPGQFWQQLKPVHDCPLRTSSHMEEWRSCSAALPRQTRLFRPSIMYVRCTYRVAGPGGSMEAFAWHKIDRGCRYEPRWHTP